MIVAAATINLYAPEVIEHTLLDSLPMGQVKKPRLIQRSKRVAMHRITTLGLRGLLPRALILMKATAPS